MKIPISMGRPCLHISLTITLFLLFFISFSLFYSSSSNTPNYYSPSTFYSTSNLLPPDHPLSYRQHLHLTTSPPAQLIHSQTLTFSHIYVLSLPTRLDRREQMSRLGHALGLNFTFVDAVSKDEPFIKWIAEQVLVIRKKKLAIMVRLPLSLREIYSPPSELQRQKPEK